MSLYFAFGDFQAESGSVAPLPLTPGLTCQGIYDYVTNLFDQNLYIAFQHGGRLILIDPTWNISECFPNIDNYQLIIYVNPIPPTPNPPFKILGISIIIKINENIVNQINAQPTQTLNDIYNSLEIPEGHQIVGVQFFDSNGTVIPENGGPFSQYPFPQPFTLNLITQLSTIVIDVYINNNYAAYQMQVPSDTMLLKLVQQIQIPQNKTIRGYGLYDCTGKLLVNTDVLLAEYQHQTQPLFLNIETQDFQQQPVVCFDIYVNGEKSVLSTFETDKTLQDIINSTQISNGEMITEFALWDASRQSIEANIQTPLQQFVARTQPLQLHIRTTQDSLQRLQSVVCLKIQIDDQREINQNVIGSKTILEVQMSEYQILNALIPEGLVIAQFFLLDASGQQLSSDSSLEIQRFANCTQPLLIQVQTTLKSFNLNVYLNNQPYVQVIAYSSNKLSEIISQIQIPADQFIQSYALLDVQQNVIATSDVVFSTLMDRIDPFSLFITVVQQQAAKKSKIRIVEVINTTRLSEESMQTSQQQPYYTQGNNNQQNNYQQFGGQGQQHQQQVQTQSNQQQQRPYSQQLQRPPYINSQSLVQPQNINQFQYQQQQFSPPQGQYIPQPQVSSNHSSPQTQQQQQRVQDKNKYISINAVQPGIGKQINIQEVQQPAGIDIRAISPDQTKKQIHIQEVQQAIGIGTITPAETRKKALGSLQILKNITLRFDDRGEYVIYQFHKPIEIKGLLLKEESSPKPQFNRSAHKWVEVKNIQYAQTGDFSFAIMWDNGNISKVKITVL